MQGRPFRHTTCDFSLMPALRWLSIRCYKAPQGHATLATGCPGLEEMELVRRGECLCGACVMCEIQAHVCVSGASALAGRAAWYGWAVW